MTLLPVERQILNELSRIEGKKLKEKNLKEWNTGELKPHEGEKLVHLEHPNVWVSYTVN